MNAVEEPTRPLLPIGPIGVGLLLIVLTLFMTLPGIGSASLWDIDEGLHATCAMEMHETRNWIIPTFNYKLFSDKPALMYWLDRVCFARGGVNEAMARLPMALATLITVLCTALVAWDMAPRPAKSLSALLSGVIVSSTISIIVAARFVNPDSLLTASITAALTIFWFFQARRSTVWLLYGSIFTALGMLAKGPIGVVIPGGVVFWFLVFQWRWREVFCLNLIWGTLIWCAIALPWFIYVGVETHFVFVWEFFFKHNLGRFSAPMESHSGPFWYYIPVLLIGFAPWSIFLTPTVWNAIRQYRKPAETTTGSTELDKGPSEREKILFLVIWAGLVFGFFSVTATKLPNYILPGFPPLAILTASYLVRRIAGTDGLPRWVWPMCYGNLALVGVITIVGLLIASGYIPIQGAKMRVFPGLELWTWLGLIPLGTLGLMIYFQKRISSQVAVLCAGGLAFSGFLGLWNGSSINPYKAPEHLAAALPRDHLSRDVNLCTWGWFQPSLVFYCKREIRTFEEPQLAEVEGFLSAPRETYLFTTEALARQLTDRGWELEPLVKRYDFYRNFEVVAYHVTHHAPRKLVSMVSQTDASSVP